LQAVLIPERLLQRSELAVGRQSLDSRDALTVDLDREHRARLDRSSIDQNGARSTLAGIAANVRACQAKVFPEEVHKKIPRLDVTGVRSPIDCNADGHPVSHKPSLNQ
jgi:hypothetical protein